jgi:hypothetical protein
MYFPNLWNEDVDIPSISIEKNVGLLSKSMPRIELLCSPMCATAKLEKVFLLIFVGLLGQ